VARTPESLHLHDAQIELADPRELIPVIA